MYNNPLKKTTLIAYSMPAIPLAMMLTPIIIYLPALYAGELGLDLSTLGIIFFIGRAFDGLSDPIIGTISDKIRFKSGRRKPWLLIGSPLLMLTTYFLCMPPKDVDSIYLFLALVGFYIAYTVMRIPYISWGAELSSGYRERNRITGFREAGTMIGVLTSIAVPYFILSPEEATVANIMKIFTITACILIPLTAAFAAWKVRDTLGEEHEKFSFISALKTVSQNKLYLRVLTGQALLLLGTYIYNAALIFIVEHSMGLKGQFLSLIMIEYAVMIALVPLAVRIASRVGKHRMLCYGIMCEILAFAAMFLVEPGVYWQAAIAFGLVGAAFAPWYVIPTSMIADTMDYGVLNGGNKVAGTYMAMYNLVDKFMLAFAAVIALPLLDLAGFDATSTNTGFALDSVAWVGLILPIIIIGGAIIIFWNYPLNRTKHKIVIRYNQRKNRSSTLRSSRFAN